MRLMKRLIICLLLQVGCLFASSVESRKRKPSRLSPHHKKKIGSSGGKLFISGITGGSGRDVEALKKAMYAEYFKDSTSVLNYLHKKTKDDGFYPDKKFISMYNTRRDFFGRPIPRKHQYRHHGFAWLQERLKREGVSMDDVDLFASLFQVRVVKNVVIEDGGDSDW